MYGYVLELFYFFMMHMWDKNKIIPLMNTNCSIYIFNMETLLLCGQILTFAILNSQKKGVIFRKCYRLMKV